MAAQPIHNIKTCTKCGEAKPATEQFFHRKGNILRARCKSCRSESRSARYAADPSREKARNAAWACANPEINKARQKRWRAANGEREAELHREWYKRNVERVAANGRRWRAENPGKAADISRRHSAQRRLDARYRVQQSIARAISKRLAGGKGGKSTFELLGYTGEQLAAHLERGFQRGMSWANYGSVWHVDHIVPQSTFRFEVAGDPEFLACWALNNLRPLLAKENIAKSNRRDFLI